MARRIHDGINLGVLQLAASPDESNTKPSSQYEHGVYSTGDFLDFTIEVRNYGRTNRGFC